MEKHISWSATEEKKLEEKIMADYSSEEVCRHLEYLTTLTRIAGSEDERKAAEYIAGKLKEYDIDSEIYEFDAYVGHPGKAELEILSPVHAFLASLPHAFIASTPPEGIEGDLVFVGKGLEKDYQSVQVKDKIVLLEPGGGGNQVEAAGLAEERGALAQIHVTDGREQVIKIMQLRNTWGNPTPETFDRIPRTPVVSIAREDGRRLEELIGKGPVAARMRADGWRGYKKIRHPIGTLEGARDPERFVLWGAHYCSWYVGATDNAAANALLLEAARIISKHRKNLGRSIKFAWWTGHTQGTFAGSTWYVDRFWDHIRDNAIAYLNMDALGRSGTSGFGVRSSEELRNFHEMIVKETLGLSVKSGRFSKIGDQSFWGIGLPSFTGNTAFPDEENPSTGGGAYWYMHSREDTLDKVDVELIRIPAQVYVAAVLRLCNSPVLPFEFVTTAGLFRNGLDDLRKEGSALDLTSLVTGVEELARKAASLNEEIGRDLAILEEQGTERGLEGKFEKINACLMGLSRILTPVLSSKAGKYGQDPMGTPFKPIPALQPLKKLDAMDRGSEEFKALYTSLLRERNRVSDALHSANGLLDDALSF